jgi:hypothetical protein
MIKTFTQDDMIRYAYHETSESETLEIEQALLCDAKLQEIYKEISGVINKLDANMKVPSQATIDSILQFAKRA